jgi:hypothetical protein
MQPYLSDTPSDPWIVDVTQGFKTANSFESWLAE